MGENILIVTGSDYSDRVYQAFEDVKKLGYRLYLLSDGSFEPRTGVFEEHFTSDLRKTKNVLEFMAAKPIKFDAVTIKTSEWLTPLTALLAKQYGCIGNDPKSAFYCRSKYHMRKELDKAGVPIPGYKLCKNFEELKAAIEEFGFPCVVKPIGANATYGTFMLKDESSMKDLESNYNTSIGYLKEKSVNDDIFEFSEEELNMIGIEDHVNMVTDYLVEEFMPGPEYSIDALVQDGKVTITGIEEQIRMSFPYPVEYESKLPYVCSKERFDQIYNIVCQTIYALGIKNSATHTEVIYTPQGFKVVEIACRIGGDDLHDVIYQVTGLNLMFEAIMIALGVKRELHVPILCHTAGSLIFAEREGVLKEIIVPEELKNDPDVFNLNMTAKPGDKIAPPPKNFDYIGFVNTKGATPEAADAKLRYVLSNIKVIYED